MDAARYAVLQKSTKRSVEIYAQFAKDVKADKYKSRAEAETALNQAKIALQKELDDPRN
jgi:predicted outer membrane protein